MPVSSAALLVLAIADSISRRTVEKVDQINAELLKNDEPIRLCTIDDVKTTYNEMTNYGSNFFLNRLGFHQKIMMLAVVQCTKRAGVPDVTASDVGSIGMPQD